MTAKTSVHRETGYDRPSDPDTNRRIREINDGTLAARLERERVHPGADTDPFVDQDERQVATRGMAMYRDALEAANGSAKPEREDPLANSLHVYQEYSGDNPALAANQAEDQEHTSAA